MGYVLKPLTKGRLMTFLDEKAVEVIKYLIRKSLFSQPEVLEGQEGRAVQVPKEHIEQWFVQALGGIPVGSGSYPIDVYNPLQHWGADIKMLNAKVDDDGNLSNADSGEASLGQKFRGVGVSLDDLFNNRQYEVIKNEWLTIFSGKINKVLLDYKAIDDIYYFFILRANNKFYLVGAEVDIDQINSVTVSHSSDQSIFLDGVIDGLLGSAKVYKAKKRLELRLKPREWVDRDLATCFSTNFTVEELSLRNHNIDDEFLKTRFGRIVNIGIDFS